MSKVDTDEGLGPGSEDRRREVVKAQERLDSRSKLEPAAPLDKSADTQPGIGKVERRNDTVDDLLDGFGPSRPDLPHRILPKEDTTPPPEPLRRELTPTQPGKRQKLRNMILASVLSFGVIVGVGVLLVRMGGPEKTSTAAPPATTTAARTTETAEPTVTATATATIPTIATTSVESLPTAVKTSSAPPHNTHVSSAHTASTASPPATTAATTTTAAPRPTGSAPPGLNLLPDDPHR